jgi:hypothetical protein
MTAARTSGWFRGRGAAQGNLACGEADNSKECSCKGCRKVCRNRARDMSVFRISPRGRRGLSATADLPYPARSSLPIPRFRATVSSTISAFCCDRERLHSRMGAVVISVYKLAETPVHNVVESDTSAGRARPLTYLLRGCCRRCRDQDDVVDGGRRTPSSGVCLAWRQGVTLLGNRMR